MEDWKRYKRSGVWTQYVYNMFPVFNEAKHSVGNIIVLGTCHYCDLGTFPNKCEWNLKESNSLVHPEKRIRKTNFNGKFH